ncbi:NADH:ubiquinone oxidoreductase intermediate-associated protein 30 [Xylaria intraflava]|nr:NADH:ubiquinone oxidoreductase intermediate-associated protein 30 [Xylaria intraflava]
MMPPRPGNHRYIFGGDTPWRAEAWVASDDGVRGGKSASYLAAEDTSVRFHGEVDTAALGGAGFASRRSPDNMGPWDLSGFDGLRLSVAGGDARRYTLVLKDEVPAGPARSSVSWECHFVGRTTELEVRWADFSPTYRGLPVVDARPLDVACIRRVGIMMRSFFGEQEGSFSLWLRYIAAVEIPGPGCASGTTA